MKDRINILLVGNEQQHGRCLKELEEHRRCFPLCIEIVQASCACEAYHIFRSGGVDAVICNEKFPTLDVTRDFDNEECGRWFALKCLQAKIPVVIVSKNNTRGLLAAELKEWISEHGIPLFDRYEDGVTSWSLILYSLLYQLMAIDMGLFEFKGDSLKVSQKDRKLFEEEDWEWRCHNFFLGQQPSKPSHDPLQDIVINCMRELGFLPKTLHKK